MNWEIQRFIIREIQPNVMAGIRDVGRFFLFVVGGIVAIIVGSFMIRGTMHMWDGNNSDDSKGSDREEKDREEKDK